MLKIYDQHLEDTKTTQGQAQNLCDTVKIKVTTI